MKITALMNPKLVGLCRALDVPRYVAVGVLESLWLTTAHQMPMGDIGRWSDEKIAGALDWPAADAPRLVGALVQEGWLDRDPVHRLVVHDWADHAPDFVKKRIARAMRRAAACEVNKATGTDADIPEVSANGDHVRQRRPCPPTATMSANGDHVRRFPKTAHKPKSKISLGTHGRNGEKGLLGREGGCGGESAPPAADAPTVQDTPLPNRAGPEKGGAGEGPGVREGTEGAAVAGQGAETGPGTGLGGPRSAPGGEHGENTLVTAPAALGGTEAPCWPIEDPGRPPGVAVRDSPEGTQGTEGTQSRARPAAAGAGKAPEVPAAAGGAAGREPPVLRVPVAGGKNYAITAAAVAEYAAAFPGLDVLGELRRAAQWARDNPGRRKTAAGMPRFLFAWLARVADAAAARGTPPKLPERLHTKRDWSKYD